MQFMSLDRTCILLSAVMIGVVPSLEARAGGSLPFDWVMPVARQNKKLMQEIRVALEAANVSVKDVNCVGTRYGTHWTYLGGGRGLPYECWIGKQVLTIDGETDYLDKYGKVILGGLDNPRVFKSTHKIRERSLHWEWKPVSESK